MSENKVGKTLHIIGVATIIIGVIGSFILSVNLDTDFPIILIVGAISSFITGMCFVGFSEIIALLQNNANQQKEIISIIKSKPMDNAGKNSPKTVLQEIESNLPQI